LEATIRNLKDKYGTKTIAFKSNRKGQLIKIGHRSSGKHYRVYLKNKSLRFEFEHKHRKTLNHYYQLLENKQFDLFEKRISYEFFKQTYKLFRYSKQTEKLDWLAQRLRQFRTRSSLTVPGSTLKTHYINQYPMKPKQKQDLITLFQLLSYLELRDDYKPGKLTYKYRYYKFPVREFADYVNANKKANHYQLIQSVDFFNCVDQNLIIKHLSDKEYQMLVTIPHAKAYKTGNQWITELEKSN
jgi:hypothetical protein